MCVVMNFCMFECFSVGLNFLFYLSFLMLFFYFWELVFGMLLVGCICFFDLVFMVIFCMSFWDLG